MTNKDYERLTVWNEKSQKACMTAYFQEEMFDVVARHVDRLYELENAIEDGTLMFLPCKVGDDVYFVNRWSSIPRIEVWRILAIEITSDGIVIGVYRITNQNQKGLFYPGSFGKEVFTTKEAAEKALEEIKK